MRNALLFLGFLLFCFSSKGQQLASITYTVDDGLPSNTVYDVIQDRDGYIWIGTDAGVSRFDGYEFKNFTTADGLSDNEVFYLAEDGEGRIWFLTFNGKLSYYKDGRIENEDTQPWLIAEPSRSALSTVLVDPDGDVWFGHRKGVTQISGRQLRFYPSPIPTSIKFVFRLPTGEIASSGAKRRVVLVKENYPWPYDSRESFIDRPNVFVFGEKLLAYINGDIVELSERGIEGTILKTEIGSSVNITEVAGDRMFLINDTYLQELVYNDSISAGRRWAIPSGVNGVHWSKEEELWLASNIYGLIRIPSLAAEVQLPNQNITSVLYHEETLYAGTLDGHLIYQNSKDSGEIDLSAQREKNHIRSILGIKGGVIAGNDHIAIRLNDEGMESYRLPMKDISETADGQIMFSKGQGLLVIPPAALTEIDYPLAGLNRELAPGRKITRGMYVSLDFIDRYLVFEERTTTAVEWPGKGIWAGTKRGLTQIPRGEERALSVTGITPRSWINHIVFDPFRNGIWISAQGTGLYFVDKTQVSHSFKTAQSMPTGNITRFRQPDGTGTLWMGSDRGVVRVTGDIKEPEITLFDRDDGIPSRFVNHVEVSDGQIFAGSQSGLGVIKLEELVGEMPFKVFVDDVILGDSIYYRPANITIPPGNSRLRIAVSAPNWKSIDAQQFSYSLDGETWTSASQRMIDLPALAPGDYEMQIKVSDPYKSKRSAIETLSLTVLPFWYETLFFQVGLFVAITGFTVLFIHSQYQRANLKQVNSELMLKNELASLKYQLRPHFFSNTLASIQALFAGGDHQLADEYVSRLSELMRSQFDIRDTSQSELATELRLIRDYIDIELLRSETKFKTEILFEPNIDLLCERIPAMLLQPFVENAIWHGLKGRENAVLVIHVGKMSANLEITIEDNGGGVIDLASLPPDRSLGRTISYLETLSSSSGKPFSARANSKLLFTSGEGVSISLIIPSVCSAH